MKKSQSSLAAFLRLAKIDNSGCWIWQGRVNISGYGYDYHPPSGLRRVHRISWWLHHGEFDRALSVCHKCDVRLCVNPGHLFLGTHMDNINDMIKKGRLVNPKGSHHGRSKLTESKVNRIRKSKLNVTETAKNFNVCMATISMIRHRKIWTHI